MLTMPVSRFGGFTAIDPCFEGNARPGIGVFLPMVGEKVPIGSCQCDNEVIAESAEFFVIHEFVVGIIVACGIPAVDQNDCLFGACTETPAKFVRE